jgi:propanediol dehydratase small subunit
MHIFALNIEKSAELLLIKQDNILLLKNLLQPRPPPYGGQGTTDLMSG